jgi:hypothetical protein
MFEQRDPGGHRFVTYELSADDFEHAVGDTIAPGCEIGIDIRSGSAVLVNSWSRIATACYNPMNDSYLVMIAWLANNPERADFPEGAPLVTA